MDMISEFGPMIACLLLAVIAIFHATRAVRPSGSPRLGSVIRACKHGLQVTGRFATGAHMDGQHAWVIYTSGTENSKRLEYLEIYMDGYTFPLELRFLGFGLVSVTRKFHETLTNLELTERERHQAYDIYSLVRDALEEHDDRSKNIPRTHGTTGDHAA